MGIIDTLKEKAMMKMLEKQMATMPPAQREMVMQMIQNNPELFKKIAEEIEARKKDGQNEMLASVAVMKKYQKEVQQAMQRQK